MLSRTLEKNIQKREIVEKLISSTYIPYSKEEAYYHYDPTKRELIVIIPVKRAKLSVGKACRELENSLEKILPDWHVEVWSELTSPKSWGFPMKDLIKVTLKRKRR